MTDPALPPPVPAVPPGAPTRGLSGSLLVGLGIMASRIAGLVREMIKARYLGATSDIAANAFTAALRIPNFLQNILGEQALSAAFIPVYCRLREEGKTAEAERLARAVFGLLALVSAVLVLLGITFAGPIVATINSGFDEATRELATELTRITFPAVGLFVIYAWSVAILNSHRHLFQSYAAPVAWNLAIIVALWLGNGPDLSSVARYAAWGSVIGAALQIAVGLPTLRRYVPVSGARVADASRSVAQVLRNFGPVAFSRSAAQVSAFIDQWIASYLGNGMMAVLMYGQTIYMLPISVFGIGVSAAELTEMARTRGTDAERSAAIRERLMSASRQIAFFIVPSAVALILLGDVIVDALYRSGRFNAMDSFWTWMILVAAAVGLLANTVSRLYQTAFYSLHDTTTPTRIALVRLALSTSIGYLLAIHAPSAIGVDARWGAVGLPLASGIAGWIEFGILRARLGQRIGPTGLAGRYIGLLWMIAGTAAGAALGVQWLIGDQHRFVRAAVVLGAYGVLYFAVARAAGVPEVRPVLRRLGIRR